jgi:universal stress protein E
MASEDIILVVIDPTAKEHPALDRATDVAVKIGASVELLICDYQPHIIGATFLDSKRLQTAKRNYLGRHLKHLEHLAREGRDGGIDIRVKAVWDRPLYEGIIRQALECDARYVFKDTHFHSAVSRALFTNTDWHLIQGCPAPLWLVKPGTEFKHPSILASVDPMHEHDTTAALDMRILSDAFELAGQLDGSVDVFHAYNAFEDPDDPARPRAAHESALNALAEQFQIGSEQFHLEVGSPVDLLPQIVADKPFDLVVMGAVSRSRLEHAIVGSTAENVLDHLSSDVLVIKPKGFISPVTFKLQPRGYYCLEPDNKG